MIQFGSCIGLCIHLKLMKLFGYSILHNYLQRAMQLVRRIWGFWSLSSEWKRSILQSTNAQFREANPQCQDLDCFGQRTAAVFDVLKLHKLQFGLLLSWTPHLDATSATMQKLPIYSGPTSYVVQVGGSVTVGVVARTTPYTSKYRSTKQHAAQCYYVRE